MTLCTHFFGHTKTEQLCGGLCRLGARISGRMFGDHQWSVVSRLRTAQSILARPSNKVLRFDCPQARFPINIYGHAKSTSQQCLLSGVDRRSVEIVQCFDEKQGCRTRQAIWIRDSVGVDMSQTSANAALFGSSGRFFLS